MKEQSEIHKFYTLQVKEALNAWAANKISDRQLEILDCHYESLDRNMSIQSYLFGDILIHAIRVRHLNILDMIESRKKK